MTDTDRRSWESGRDRETRPSGRRRRRRFVVEREKCHAQRHRERASKMMYVQSEGGERGREEGGRDRRGKGRRKKAEKGGERKTEDDPIFQTQLCSSVSGNVWAPSLKFWKFLSEFL